MVESTETAAIERDLARTRARMDHRLEELQDRLSPGQIVNDAFAYFRGGEGADFTQELVGKLRANPLPALLTGVGLAWLMASSSRRAAAPRRVYVEHDVQARLRAAEANVIRQPDESDEAHAGHLDEARGKVLGVVRDASDTAESYAQRVKDALSSATQSARETLHDLTANASNAASGIGNSAQRNAAAAQEGFGTVARSTRDAFSSITGNPLALGAFAAVVGLIAGSLIPTTDEEEHALGAAAGKLRQAGRDLAQDVVDRGGRVASEALGAVKDSAQAHGLSLDKPVGELVADARSGALGETVKQTAGEVVSATKDSAQTHFSGGSGSEDQGQGQRG